MRWRFIISLVLACAAFASAIVSSHAGWQRQRAVRQGQELMYFPSGDLLRLVAVGNEMLAADLVWLRGVQYYGEHRLGDGRFPWIGHIFDIATRLDPSFENAYLFGALVLAGENGDAHAAIRFLKRGYARNPDSYLLAFEIGFHYHVFLRDFVRAAAYYELALQKPGCPEHVKRFAAYAWDRSDRIDQALALWVEVAETATHPIIRNMARERIAELEQSMMRGEAD